MPSKHAADKPGRGSLYMIGGILLVLTLTGYWFADEISVWFEGVPEASSLEGTWVYDGDRARDLQQQILGPDRPLPPPVESGYSHLVYTFAPGTLAIGNGSGTPTPSACKVEGFAPNAFLVTLGEGQTQRELVFQLDTSTGIKQLLLNVYGSVIPFKLQ